MTNLHIRQHFPDGGHIHSGHQTRMPHITFALLAFLGQYVLLEGLVSFDFPGSGCRQPLGGTPVGFYLWHSFFHSFSTVSGINTQRFPAPIIRAIDPHAYPGTFDGRNVYHILPPLSASSACCPGFF
ncbi:MAG: hypothetical protein HW380_2587 [Magnetococcales bacterium]|nr:hypothetical protein [Magnetococcales bacterium]